MPTVILILQIRSMGASTGARLRVAANLFHFHPSLTLRLDFWLSLLTGLSRRASCSLWRCSLDPAGGSGEPHKNVFSRRYAALIILICGCLRARSVRSCAGSSQPVSRGGGARPGHQPVRPARFAAGGRAADGGGRQAPRRPSPRRRDVRRFSRLHRRRAVAHPAGGGRPARRRLRRPGRHSRPRGRHREQVSGRRLSRPVRRAARDLRCRAPRGRRGTRDADRDGAHQRARPAGRSKSASASISARSSPAISARPGARNTRSSETP